MATCRDCRASVLWLKLAERDGSICVNDGRVLRGSVRLDDDGARFVKGDPMVPGYVPHVITCPEAKRKRAAKAQARKDEKERKEKRQLKLFG